MAEAHGEQCFHYHRVVTVCIEWIKVAPETRALQDEGILGHSDDGCAEEGPVDGRDAAAVDEDLPFGEVGYTENGGDERGFATILKYQFSR